jgi:membrane protein implicated in regulation of membrane protease activity
VDYGNIDMWINILIWLVVVVLAIVVEVNTIQLVSVWFAISGFVAMILAAFGCLIEIQLIVFVLLSAILIIISRFFVKKLNTGKNDNSTAESLVGEEVVVIKEIKAGEIGEIKAKYEKYSALAPNSINDIPVGTLVIIKEIRGNKVIVDLK